MEYLYNPLFENKISRIGLGTLPFKRDTHGKENRGEIKSTILAALDKGINIIDTAPVYGDGYAEELIGEVIEEFCERKNIILTTKVGLSWKNGRIRRDSSVKQIKMEVKKSLKRLRTDYIDVYYIQSTDPEVGIEKIALCMKRLYKKGLIRAIGVSNFSVDEMSKFLTFAPIHMVQHSYNLFERNAEEHIIPFCEKNNINTVACSTLSNGLLAGDDNINSRCGLSVIKKVNNPPEPSRNEKIMKRIKKLKMLAQERFDKDILHLALRWVLDKREESIVLWGARKPEQLGPVDDIMHWSIDNDTKNKISNIIKDSSDD
jgi:aryl-alcohol dehydrogenase-like predicted oxidoreductase